MNVLLISTYELGRQPFGLASPAAWLRRRGFEVSCLDLSIETLAEAPVAAADLIAFHVPMHTATRLAGGLVTRVRAINPRARLCFYGLYAPLNEAWLRGLGASAVLGGEFEPGLVALAERLASAGDGTPPDGSGAQPEPVVSTELVRFLPPERDALPPLDRYARLHRAPGDLRAVGYTEASRGCKHLCRHCPIVPVYRGRFRAVQREVVLEDVRRQVARGAKHVTFGDPDFLNGPAHAERIVRELHREFPELTYDVTIKIEHLLGHEAFLPLLRDTGCLFVTSAVEAVDDRILERLDKGHTRADFLEVARRMRRVGLALNPTFVTFTPWTTPEGYLELLDVLLELDLVEHVAPVQYAIRLLITASSRLLELPEVRALAGPFDEQGLVHPWKHPDPRVDRLFEEVSDVVRGGQREDVSRRENFLRVREAALRTLGRVADRRPGLADAACVPDRASVPYLTEPWYC